LFALTNCHIGQLYKTPPQRFVRISDCIAACAHDTAPTEKAPLHSGERWLAAKYFGAAKTKARCGTANTETSILLLAKLSALDEAPDNKHED
jgi:hypothetical protein